MTTQTKTVVIIGGSYAGSNTAHAVLKSIPNTKVVLINPSKQLFFNVAAPRILAKPNEFAPSKYLFQVSDLFKKYDATVFEFVQGYAKSIDVDAKIVTVEGEQNKTIPFDYLVIASGSTSHSTIGQNSLIAPFKSTGSDDLQSTIEEAQKTIQRAQSIVIGGAGPVGVEFAGELAEAYKSKPNASVTLISGSDRLLPVTKPSVSASAQGILEDLGVKVLTGRRVQTATHDPESRKWIIELDGEETITADFYVATTGLVPHNEFIPARYLSSDGWVNVDKYFRVKDAEGTINPPIFAVGDITTHPVRLLSRVRSQVSVLVSNLRADITNAGMRSTYSSDQRLMLVVPMGRKAGAGQIGNWGVWSWLVTLIKGRDYFVGWARSMYGK